MNLTIEITEELAAALQSKAKQQGISPDGFARRILEGTLAADIKPQSGLPPFKTGYGMWAKYGPGPSEEEIDENRREMFRNFAQDD